MAVASYYRVEVLPMAISDRSMMRFLKSTSIVLIFLFSGLFIIAQQDDDQIVAAIEPTRADGPIVNRSVVTITLHENFGEYIGSYLNMTGYGPEDIFFDPNHEWKEGDDIPYPHKAFSAKYPGWFTRDTTPILIDFESYYQNVHFGYVTITCQDDDFNSYIYGEEYFKITLIGRNGTGESQAELWISIINVNDRPTVISEKDFFSIQMDEDGMYDGINKDHHQPDEIFGDLKDADDILTYSYEAQNPLGENISVDMETDGSSVIFTPPKDWSCPYVPVTDRLKGKNYKPGGGKSWTDFFAHYKFNCSDAAGAYVIGDLYVYVGPVNDTPILVPINNFYVNEDEMARIQFEGSDVDPEIEQVLVYGTNITEIMYDRTGIQLEFEEGYSFDKSEGLLEFNTNNKMVGDYPVAAWTKDRPSEELGSRGDYPTTNFRVYANFTLHIVNQNDPPKAFLGSPTPTFKYNTTYPVELNATLSSDPDMVHGQTLTYKWYANGEYIGEGAVFHYLFETEGEQKILLNVTDGEFWDTKTVDIVVEKARILGEIFTPDINIDTGFTDNVSDPLVFHRNPKEAFMEFGGRDSIDIRSLDAVRDGPHYKIRMIFGEEMIYIYNDETRQEPVLTLYFLKPGFEEAPISPKTTDIGLYQFPVPTSNYRYNNMEFDLRTLYPIKYPLQDSLPGFRRLDTKMGVEISLTIVELDMMNIKPDFQLYATVVMKTTIPQSDGGNTVITSWDAIGVSARVPQVDLNIGDSDDDGEDYGSSTGVIIIIVVIIILVLLGVGVFLAVFLTKKRRSGSESQPLSIPAQPEQTVDEMVFGAPQKTSAEQLYGTQQPQPLPEGQPPAEGLPPAQLPETEQVETGKLQAEPGQADEAQAPEATKEGEPAPVAQAPPQV